MQRYSEPGTAAKPGGSTILWVAGDDLHPIEHREYTRGAERIAEQERAFRIIETELDGGVDIGWRGDPQLGDTGADVDDHGQQALHHEARTVVDHRDRHITGRQSGDRGAERVRFG